jgi:CheY-like chemotaxis protein
VVHSAIIDVSQRKLDEERQRTLLEREHSARLLAESVDRVKREILTVVSHELRTPLAPMRLWVNALRIGGLSDRLRARAIDALETCLKVQVALIDDLIDVARGQSGKLKIERRPMDLAGVVGAAIEAYAPSAAAKQIDMKLEVDPLPAWVSGDSTRLQQVVGNLVSNAIKFTPEAGHIAVSLHARGAEVSLVVADDGEGIEAEMLERIFEPFHHRDMTATRRHGGLGVGLTIVRQLVKEHDGRIVAESAGPRRGTRFTMTLPALEESERPGGEASAWTLAESRAALRRLDRVRVLLVEDDEHTRDAVAGTLRTHGAEVTTAASAADARDALERARPDVVVSDIGMPQEDGNTFIRNVRAQEQAPSGPPHLPALALTIHDREEALTAGFDLHLAKPFESESLVKLLESLASVAPRWTNIGAPSGL